MNTWEKLMKEGGEGVNRRHGMWNGKRKGKDAINLDGGKREASQPKLRMFEYATRKPVLSGADFRVFVQVQKC